MSGCTEGRQTAFAIAATSVGVYETGRLLFAEPNTEEIHDELIDRCHAKAVVACWL